MKKICSLLVLSIMISLTACDLPIGRPQTNTLQTSQPQTSSTAPCITGIVLSTNNLEMRVGESVTLSYVLFPENAKSEGLTWRSADTNIAKVDKKGQITAVKSGQTTVYISSKEGVMATCSVTIIEKPAYDRLSQNERELVDCILMHIEQFKNPGSLQIKAVEKDESQWIVKVSAQNGFGGNNITTYYLSESLGFWNWESLDIDLDITISPDSSYNINLINEAIKEKY